MENEFYHGTSGEINLSGVNPKSGIFDLCLCSWDAYDDGICNNYIGGNDDDVSGRIYRVSLKSWARIVDVEKVVWEIEQAGIEIPEDLDFEGECFYRLLEMEGVMELLAEEHIHVVAYDDVDYYGQTHRTWRVLDADAVESTQIEETVSA